MRVTILGSGTSSGVPMIGCNCPVCTSDNPKNRRFRSSVAVEFNNRLVLLDTATDLRQQALRYELPRVDAVLFTHAHADHIHGIDELRAFNFRFLRQIPCYGNQDVIRRICKYFEYIFDEGERESIRPFLTMHAVDGSFSLFGQTVTPVPLWHGSLSVLGYRLGDFAYLTDVSRIPDASWELLGGLELVILDALRPRPHKTHFSIDQALQVVERIKPKRAVLTHLSHMIEHEKVNKDLPKPVELAYDGMVLDLTESIETERSES
ncbi:MAG: GPMC system MBL fold metallohydrolase [Deltaproteobacteria bacterium]|nr:GPMC system MBL fold metallohydrolase [Deltaproteobacteria bacterium]